MKHVLRNVENTVGKREKYWFQAFSTYSSIFLVTFSQDCQNFKILGKEPSAFKGGPSDLWMKILQKY